MAIVQSSVHVELGFSLLLMLGDSVMDELGLSLAFDDGDPLPGARRDLGSGAWIAAYKALDTFRCLWCSQAWLGACINSRSLVSLLYLGLI